jgi:hypothetical protein
LKRALAEISAGRDLYTAGFVHILAHFLHSRVLPDFPRRLVIAVENHARTSIARTYHVNDAISWSRDTLEALNAEQRDLTPPGCGRRRFPFNARPRIEFMCRPVQFNSD